MEGSACCGTKKAAFYRGQHRPTPSRTPARIPAAPARDATAHPMQFYFGPSLWHSQDDSPCPKASDVRPHTTTTSRVLHRLTTEYTRESGLLFRVEKDGVWRLTAKSMPSLEMDVFLNEEDLEHLTESSFYRKRAGMCITGRMRGWMNRPESDHSDDADKGKSLRTHPLNSHLFANWLTPMNRDRGCGLVVPVVTLPLKVHNNCHCDEWSSEWLAHHDRSSPRRSMPSMTDVTWASLEQLQHIKDCGGVSSNGMAITTVARHHRPANPSRRRVREEGPLRRRSPLSAIPLGVHRLPRSGPFRTMPVFLGQR
ncbi:hypothetical protein BDZ85DRAFT_314523 [Elsinoe ampelina]|uniref:Uncharacterized protein n=1 Tax=Elsinoe ampelina TaxID=302913 RepID=A0A6A6G8X2_9PEZI|nr:hypothetical protein BDZ85DRAFT_314523 [Elsinoe ampelina]